MTTPLNDTSRYELLKSGHATDAHFDRVGAALNIGLIRAESIDPLCEQTMNEAREHITDGTPCWCNPETTYKDPDTGASVVVHKEPQ